MRTRGDMTNSNGGGQAKLSHLGNGTSTSSARPEREAVLAAVDLLSHFWSRPLPEEVETWVKASELTAETHRLVSADPESEPVKVPTSPEETLGLLDEYERLFVGPGQVPCPPYESFWREDVPVDIRRTLMGPCTAELKELYQGLGLQVSAASGELPDHVAIELEALAVALSRDDSEELGRRLYQEHLGQFLPRLCRAVTHDAESDFYRELAALSLDWMSAIRSYFAVAQSA